LYNTLALQNTDLIRTYTEIDQRTKILGHVVKHFSKICSIGDINFLNFKLICLKMFGWMNQSEKNIEILV
jgi:hypothetical protein